MGFDDFFVDKTMRVNYFHTGNRGEELIALDSVVSDGRWPGKGAVEFNLSPERDAATTLAEFGETYIAMLCRPGGGSAIRTVMAIAERMPEVGRRYYASVLKSIIDRLAAYLEARVNGGELAIDDCQHAASQFMLLCQASLFLPFVFQAAPPPSHERIAQVVESATRMFLAAYGAKAL